MEALKLLFTSWMGLLTVFVVVFAIGMITFIALWLRRNVFKAEHKA
ncbi:MAG: DUF3149 domain-containing protein [Pseudomonadota bacterium]